MPISSPAMRCLSSMACDESVVPTSAKSQARLASAYLPAFS